MRLALRLLLFAILTAGCGQVTAQPPDSGPGTTDAALPIDAATPIDASIDAPPTPPPPPGTARELAVVGGAVADGRFQLEVEVTAGVAGGSARDATHQFDNAITVTLSQGAN